MRKGLILLIAATLAGSSCFADTLYDSGLLVAPVEKVKKTSHTYEISELKKKLSTNEDDITTALQLSELLHLDGDRLNSLLLIGSSIVKIRDNQEKVDAFKKILMNRIEANPDYDFNYIVLGKTYKILNDDDATIKEYQKALEIDPDNSYIQVELARIYQKQGNYTSALQIYNTILKKSPYAEAVRPFRGDCYYELGQKDKAEADYRAGLKMEPEIFNSAAGLYMCLKDEKSIPAIYKEIYPAYKTKPILAKNYIDFATNFKYIQNNQKEIDRLYQEVLKVDPENITAYKELEYSYYEQKNYKDLKKLLYKCMTPIKDKTTGNYKNVDYPTVQIAARLAHISPDPFLDAKELIKTNHKREAAAILDKIEDNTYQLCLLKANIFSEIDEPNNAINWYKKALELSPNDKKLLYTIANEYKKIEDYEGAKEFIKQALAISPKNRTYLSLQKDIIIKENKHLIATAWNSIDENNNELLTETIDRLFENKYIDPEAYVIRGLLKQTNDDNEGALQDYIKANEMDPKNVLALRLAGELSEAKDTNQAIKYYKQCLLVSKDPENDDAKYAASRLIELNQIVPVNLITK